MLSLSVLDPGKELTEDTEGEVPSKYQVWIKTERLVGVVVKDIGVGGGGRGFDSRVGLRGHIVANGSPFWEFFLELCCLGAKLRYSLHLLWHRYLLHASA